MTAQIELELKLTGRPDVLRALPKSAAFSNYIEGPPKRRILTTVYFDTPDYVLHQAKVAWRIRRQGRHFLHSIKFRTDGQSGVMGSALEIEQVVSSDRPDPVILRHQSLAAYPAISKLLVNVLARTDFGPLFESHIRRTIYNLRPDKDSLVELAIDVGELRSGANVLAVEEAEFEIKAGTIEAVYNCAEKAIGISDLRIEPESKAQRGYRLAQGKVITVHKATDISLPKKATIEDALYGALKSTIAQIAVNGRVFELTGEPESVHQLRVGLRRARAAFSLFRDVTPGVETAQLKQRLKTLADQFGALRDMDVFLGEVIPGISRELETIGLDISLDPLISAALVARDKARDLASDAIAAREYTQLLIDFDRYLETRGWRRAVDAPMMRLLEPIDPFARHILNARLKRTLRAAKGLDKLVGDERHRVRIELKKLRYGSMFFSSLFGKRMARDYLEILAGMQDFFGGINDAYVAEGIIKALISSAEGDVRSDLAFAGGVAIGMNAARAGRDWSMVIRRWPDFAREKPFWHEE